MASEQPQQSPVQGRGRMGTLSTVTFSTLCDVATDLPPKQSPQPCQGAARRWR